jgi:hypothetical protein
MLLTLALTTLVVIGFLRIVQDLVSRSIFDAPSPPGTEGGPDLESRGNEHSAG